MKTSHPSQRIFLFLIILLAAVAMLRAQTVVPPLIREGREDFKRERERWIEDMHRVEPGVDYRIIDRETREARLEARIGAARKADAMAGTWTERGSDNLAGRMHTADIDFDRGRIFAASAGGNVWKGTLAGAEWTSLTDPMRMTIEMVRVIPHQGGMRVLAAGGGKKGVYHSDDDGASWQGATGLENIANWGSIRRTVLANDAAGTVYVLAKEWDYTNWVETAALYASADHGDSFSCIARRRLGGAPIETYDLWAPRYDAPDVYFVHRDTLSKILPGYQIQSVATITLDRDYAQVRTVWLNGSVQGGAVTLYIMTTFNGSSYCYRTTDGGASWALRGKVTNVQPFSPNSFCVSSLDPDQLAVGGVEAYRSYDGGITWELVNGWGEYYGNPEHRLHADIPGINAFRMPAGGEMMLIATDGGLFKSTDGLRTVTNIGQRGLNVSQYYSILTNRGNTSFVYAGSQDQGFQRSIAAPDQKMVFTQLISGDYGHLSSGNGGRSLWCVYPGFILHYPNTEDASPVAAGHWDFASRGRLWMPPIIVDPEDASSAYVAVGGTDAQSKITHVSYIRASNSITGQELPFDFAQGSAGAKVSAIACSPFDATTIYVSTNNGDFYVSSDGGSTWVKTAGFGGPGGHYFYGSSILPSAKRKGWIMVAGSGYSNPGVFVSTDNGATFDDTLYNDGLPHTLIYELAMTPDEQYIFAATEVGPYMYRAADRRWIDLTNGIAPDQTYWTVEYVPSLRTARFGTYGRGIWDYTLDATSAIEPAGGAHAPQDFTVTVSPNPTAGDAVISFTLAEAAPGAVRIYDMQGRMVNEAGAGIFARGVNAVTWNGASGGGHALPAGVYLCIVRAAGAVRYAKIMKTR